MGVTDPRRTVIRGHSMALPVYSEIRGRATWPNQIAGLENSLRALIRSGNALLDFKWLSRRNNRPVIISVRMVLCQHDQEPNTKIAWTKIHSPPLKTRISSEVRAENCPRKLKKKDMPKWDLPFVHFGSWEPRFCRTKGWGAQIPRC